MKIAASKHHHAMKIQAWAIPFIVTLNIGVFVLASQFIGRHWATPAVAALTFLTNLHRPCFLIDVQAVQRWCSEQQSSNLGPNCRSSKLPIPPIYLPSSNECLIANPIVDNPTNSHFFDKNLNPIDLSAAPSDTCLGYIHCQVVAPSLSQMQDETFLAQLNVALPWNEERRTHDRKISCTDHFSSDVPTPPAYLVLGLNNHHVVSYYWARSAGAGAAMEAPGVVVEQAVSGKAQLRWASNSGFTDCNSNDGKRSEWVKFLKDGDHVQLRPTNMEAAIYHFREDIYGISMSGRPLGSDPNVVCKWNIVSA